MQFKSLSPSAALSIKGSAFVIMPSKDGNNTLAIAVTKAALRKSFKRGGVTSVEVAQHEDFLFFKNFSI